MESPLLYLHLGQHATECDASRAPGELQGAGWALTCPSEIRETFQYKHTFRVLNPWLVSWPQAPNDSLDLHLNSVHDQSKDFLRTKSQVLYQKETVYKEDRWGCDVILKLHWHCFFKSLCFLRKHLHLISHVILQGTRKRNSRGRDQSVGGTTEAHHSQR